MKHTKKLLALVLATLLVCSMAFVVASATEETAGVTFTASPATVENGAATVTISVETAENVAIAATYFSVEVSEGLSLATWTSEVTIPTVNENETNAVAGWNVIGESLDEETGKYVAPYKFGFVYFGTNADGDFTDAALNATITLNLAVADTFESGMVTINPIETINMAEEAVEMAAVSAAVTVVPKCDHSNTKLVPNGNGTHNVVCANEDCGEVITENVACTLEEVAGSAVESTCTVAGKDADKACECGYTVEGAARELADHTEVTETKDATCTEAGYTKVTCSVCGETISETVIEATGHSHVKGELVAATRKTDAYYTYTCACGDSYTETVATQDLNVTFSHTTAFTSAPSVAVLAVLPAKVEADRWAEFTLYGYVTEEGVTRVEKSVYEVEGSAINTTGRVFMFKTPGIPAKQMNDRVEMVYYQIVDGIKYKSTVTDVFNFVSYYEAAVAAYNKSATAENKALVELLEQMFNYGSAAQIFFEYNKDVNADDAHSGLVNAHIPAENRKNSLDSYKDLTLDYTVEKKGDTAGKSMRYYGQRGSYRQELSISLLYVATANVTNANELMFKATYEDAIGNLQTIEISGENFVISNGRVVELTLNMIPAKDLCSLITGAIYNVAGEEDVQVSDTITTSFASYATSIVNSAEITDEEKMLAKASIVYSQKALAYFQAKPAN